VKWLWPWLLWHYRSYITTNVSSSKTVTIVQCFVCHPIYDFREDLLYSSKCSLLSYTSNVFACKLPNIVYWNLSVWEMNFCWLIFWSSQLLKNVMFVLIKISYFNTTVTWGEPLKIRCLVIVTLWGTTAEQSARKYRNLPLQAKEQTSAHYCITLDLTLVQCEYQRQIKYYCNNLIK